MLALDVVGFSAMMNRDEMGTLRRVQTFQKSIVQPAVAEYRGRVFKVMGDGALSEFKSVHDAFGAALAILDTLSRSELDINIRIGLHIGDLIFEDGDVFGDGVNVAARLEGVAQPGCIAVSERAYTELSRTHSGFDDLGRVSLKNIREPVRVYQYSSAPARYGFRWGSHWRRWSRVALGIGALLLMAGAVLWWATRPKASEQIVREELADFPCSWLGLRRTAQVNGATVFEVEGGAMGEAGAVRRKLLTDLARLTDARVSINVENVNHLPSSFCDFTERFKTYRYKGPPRFMAKLVRSDGAPGFLPAPRPGAIVVIRIYPDTFRKHATWFGLESNGAITRLFDLGELSRELVSTKKDDYTEIQIFSDSKAVSALLVIDSDKLIPDDVVVNGRLDTASFERLDAAAQDGDWNVELIWYDFGAVPNSVTAE